MPVAELTSWLRETMWSKVGILREADSIRQAIAGIDAAVAKHFAGVVPKCRKALELRNMLVVASMAAQGALLRTESRGGHCRTDFPAKDDAWLKHTVLQGGRTSC
jgi:succinate dehydrogenase/fumarate reductase flavoprotein subunit